MTRVSKQFINQFEELESIDVLKKKSMMIVIDMINGFIKFGALKDYEIHKITPNIKTLLHLFDNSQTIFFRDAHQRDSVEFKSYPIHCIEDDEESDIIDELKEEAEQAIIIKKNSTNGFATKEFMNLLEKEIDHIDQFIVVGCCSDICVLQFCLGLNAYINENNIKDKTIIVPIDCNETYHIDHIHDAIQHNEFAFNNMKMNGIHVVKTIKE